MYLFYLRTYIRKNYATVEIHHKGRFPLSRNFPYVYMHVNFNHVSNIEPRYKVLRLNEKLSEVQLLRLRVAFQTLPLFYLRTQNFTPVST